MDSSVGGGSSGVVSGVGVCGAGVGGAGVGGAGGAGGRAHWVLTTPKALILESPLASGALSFYQYNNDQSGQTLVGNMKQFLHEAPYDFQNITYTLHIFKMLPSHYRQNLGTNNARLPFTSVWGTKNRFSSGMAFPLA